ncbi:hypothetical protein H0H93_000959, partial [Arthromyces matolae]
MAIPLAGDRGVYLARDFRSSSLGCSNADVVVLKAWTKPDDQECVSERAMYQIFQSASVSGVPKLIQSAQDDKCGIYGIALQRLGPTIEDLIQALPGHRLDEKLVLDLAIQM